MVVCEVVDVVVSLVSSRSHRPSRASPGVTPWGGRSTPRAERRRRSRSGWERGGSGAEDACQLWFGATKTGRGETYMLVEVVVPREELAARRPLALEGCEREREGPNVSLRNERRKDENPDSRFSFVWIDLTWRLRCSLLLKHLPHPGTLQRKIFFGLPVLVTPQSGTNDPVSLVPPRKERKERTANLSLARVGVRVSREDQVGRARRPPQIGRAHV